MTTLSETIDEVHMRHCFQGEYEISCKYGDPDCPAEKSSRSNIPMGLQTYGDEINLSTVNLDQATEGTAEVVKNAAGDIVEITWRRDEAKNTKR